MLKGISDTLNIQQRSQTVVPATSTKQVLLAPQALARPVMTSHRLQSYQKWAKITQGQHDISANQLADKGLQYVRALLRQLHEQLKLSRDNIHDNPRDSATHTRAKQLQSQLASLDVRYQGHPLIDHQLNLISAARPAAKYRFTLASVDLSIEKQRDEYINIQLGNGIYRALLPAKQPSAQLAQQLSLALKPLNIQVVTDKAGQFSFSCTQARWQQVQAGLLMTGQGQRLPAGDARTIKVNEQLNWQDPREWRFSTPEDTKQTIVKITKSQHKIESQLQELASNKRKIHQQLQNLNAPDTAEHDIAETINQLAALMQPSPFHLQVTSLLAQANMTRTQVSALL
ncbi:hypothetical protein N9W21_06310 [Shewanella sp.]|nr:hypothetical protein [Shewanella sp.]